MMSVPSPAGLLALLDEFFERETTP